MTERDLIGDLRLTRERFATLVAEIRPELHRYCARMTGSIADGEDVVQDTLARAYYALAELDEVPPLRAWLFRIAHNRGRSEPPVRSPQPRDRRRSGRRDPEDTLARAEALHAAVSRFGEL